MRLAITYDVARKPQRAYYLDIVFVKKFNESPVVNRVCKKPLHENGSLMVFSVMIFVVREISHKRVGKHCRCATQFTGKPAYIADTPNLNGDINERPPIHFLPSLLVKNLLYVRVATGGQLSMGEP